MGNHPHGFSDALASELDSARRTLEELAVTLCLDSIVFERHAEALQRFDKLAQVIGEVANVLRCNGVPHEAMAGVRLEEMRLRLMATLN